MGKQAEIGMTLYMETCCSGGRYFELIVWKRPVRRNDRVSESRMLALNSY